MTQGSRVCSPARAGTMIPSSQNKRISRRAFAVTFLCLVLLVSLAGGGAWTYIRQQYLLSSHRTSTTAHVIPFASVAVTVPVTNYRTFISTKGSQFGFDVQHTHDNPYERILSPSNIKCLLWAWAVQTGKAIFSSPTVANGVVYVSSVDGKLYAFHL